MKSTKNIKIGKKYRRRKYDSIIVSEIRLCGKWLEIVGFKIGDTIQIESSQNKIIITSNNCNKKL